MYLSRSTWQALGLGVAAGYAVLGSFSALFPSTASKTLFDLGSGVALWPVSRLDPPPPLMPSGQPPRPTETDRAVAFLLPLLGVRDLSIAAAIIALDWQGRYTEVGTVILGGMILCAADVAAIWRRRGPVLGSVFLVGALQWAVTGWGLQFWY